MAYIDIKNVEVSNGAPVDDELLEKIKNNFSTMKTSTEVITSEIADLVTLDSWSLPTFKNTWHNYNYTWLPVQYYKDDYNRVHLRGMGAGPINAVAFTLPPGYRPSLPEIFMAQVGDGIGRIDVYPNGDVVVQLGNSSAWASFSNVSFRAEQ